MAVTYNDGLTTDKDKVRFAIQDTVSGSGRKPDRVNFSDAEILALIDNEGTWQGAVAACFEALAAAWQNNPIFGVSELGTSHAKVSEGFKAQAESWRTKAKGDSISSIGFLNTVREAIYIQNQETLDV